MPYAMQVFRSENQKPLRTVMIDGEPWFVLADACRLLDLNDKKGWYGHHAERLDDDEKKAIQRSSLPDDPSLAEGGPLGGSPMLQAINESGLFALILGSVKPEAKRLRKWVTSEVLPSIRRTGSYSTAGSASLGVWQPFHDRISLTQATVPEGYFCIFREMADLTAQLITQGALVNDETVPDISLGQAWGKEWETRGHEHDFGARIKYEHNYPAGYRQAKSNPQWPWCYPEDALSAFRRWLRHTYLPTAYPKYLATKEKKGHIPAIVVQAALKAVEVSRPKPLR